MACMRIENWMTWHKNVLNLTHMVQNTSKWFEPLEFLSGTSSSLLYSKVLRIARQHAMSCRSKIFTMQFGRKVWQASYIWIVQTKVRHYSHNGMCVWGVYKVVGSLFTNFGLTCTHRGVKTNIYLVLYLSTYYFFLSKKKIENQNIILPSAFLETSVHF